MGDALEQAEIDALLDAVSEGDIDVEIVDPHIFSRSRDEDEPIEIQEYDFRRPERIGKERMRGLETLHDVFARSFGASLSGFLRTIVEIRVVGAEQMSYAEFVSGLPNPTSFNLVHADALDGPLCMEISPLIIYPIIDRLLGGTSHDLFIPQRPVTQIEKRLIQTILGRAMPALAEAWSSLATLSFRLGEMESNPQLMQIVPPSEPVVVIGIEIKMTGRAGTMSLCIPYTVIEPLLDRLTVRTWAPTRHAIRPPADGAGTPIDERLGDTVLELTAVLAETTITVARLQSLEVGDIITTDRAAGSPIMLEAGGLPKLLAELGQRRGVRAAQIIRAWPDAGRGHDHTGRPRFRIAGSG